MAVERTDVGWRFWLGWVAASLLGSLLGNFVPLLFPCFSWSAWGPNPPLALAAVFATIGGAVAGVATGILQQHVLRRHVSQTVHTRWVRATAVGWTVGHAVGGVFFMIAYPVAMSLPSIIIGVVTGIVGGTLQGILLLERHHILRVVWWVAASVAGWILSTALVLAIFGLEDTGGFLTLIVNTYGGGAMYGAITGAVLVWLLRQPGVYANGLRPLPETEAKSRASPTMEEAPSPELHPPRAAALLPEIDLLSEIERSPLAPATVEEPPLPKPRPRRTIARRWPLLVGLVMGLGMVVLVMACLVGLAGIVPAIVGPPTPTPYQGNLPLRITGQDGKEMVLVPAGEFLMGSSDGLFSAAGDEEKPQHTVYLDAFYIDKTEVTTAEFCRFLNEKGNHEENGVLWIDIDYGTCRVFHSGGHYQPQAGYADCPVVEVTWYGAQAYTEWAGKRLPTEAEWEKAARGTDGRIYPWGNTWDPAKANTCEYDRGVPIGTTPVGSYPAGVSPYGALDMAGNVREWCADWYDPDYYSRSPARNPAGPDSGESRVDRGGAWNANHDIARCAWRESYPPDLSSFCTGFRCAVSASP